MKIIGHRGAKGLAPENTLASFEKAIEHHVDMIELDVRTTKEGKAVLLHDDHLTDAAGNKLAVKDYAFAELQKHKANLTTLDAAIAHINRRVPLIIEIKPGEPTAQTIKIVRSFLKRGWEPDDLLFISFNYQILKDLRIAFPDHILIVNDLWSSVRAVWRARRLGTKHVDIYHLYVWSGFVKSMHKRGYHLYTFPLNNPKKAARWQKYGLAGVVTDYPDRFENKT